MIVQADEVSIKTIEALMRPKSQGKDDQFQS